VCFRHGSKQPLQLVRRQAQFGALYGPQNVAISGIHTHSGPGGYLQYLLYDITSLGFVRESFDALVDGIVLVSWQSGNGEAYHAMIGESAQLLHSCRGTHVSAPGNDVTPLAAARKMP
jgi:Neutral/alkaline non-lysosomal ceramidase, N-terminal